MQVGGSRVITWLPTRTVGSGSPAPDSVQPPRGLGPRIPGSMDAVTVRRTIDVTDAVHGTRDVAALVAGDDDSGACSHESALAI